MLSSLFFRKKTMTSSSTTTAAADIIKKPKQSTMVITQESLGLKTLANTTSLHSTSPHPNCVNRNTFMPSSKSPSPSLSPPSPPPRSEDGVFFEDEEEKEEEEEEDDNGYCWATYGKRRTQLRQRFPPPIPLLARTGNLTGHMPWVLKRIYTDDGSLVLREVKVERHEYFRATRVDGRLTLHLVELGGDHRSPPFVSGPQCDDKEDINPQSSSSDDYDHEDLELEREEIDDDIERDLGMGRKGSLRSSMAATMNLLSSSLPDSACGTRWTSLMQQLDVKGTPVVRGY